LPGLGVAENDGHVKVFTYNDEIYRERSHETINLDFLSDLMNMWGKTIKHCFMLWG
jgi:hypothetical protein